MIDYGFKSTILKTDVCKRINNIDKQRYLNAIKEGVIVDYDLDTAYFDLVLEYGVKAVEEGRKINKARFQRSKRLEKRINDMLDIGHCIFCTFNFSDEVLNGTTEETRKVYVTRFLKSLGSKGYVANKDFGSDKEYIDRHGNKRQATSREHYHALVCIDEIKAKWQYGYQYLEHVHVKNATSKKLSKYISKLTNHAIKESTKRSALIYSR